MMEALFKAKQKTENNLRDESWPAYETTTSIPNARFRIYSKSDVRQHTSGNRFGHSEICRARFIAVDDGGESAAVMWLK